MLLIYKFNTLLLFAILVFSIFTHGEIGQERYGIVSREKKNNKDRAILVILVLFFLNIGMWTSCFWK